MATTDPPDWFTRMTDFSEFERRMLEATRRFEEAVDANGPSWRVLPDEDMIELIRGADGVWRASLEETSLDPEWKSIHVDPIYTNMYIVDEVADVDPDVYKRGPRKTITGRFTTDESSVGERDDVAQRASVRRAAGSVPYWRNRHDFLLGPILKSPRPMVGIDWAEGSDQTVVSTTKKPDVL